MRPHQEPILARAEIADCEMSEAQAFAVSVLTSWTAAATQLPPLPPTPPFTAPALPAEAAQSSLQRNSSSSSSSIFHRLAPPSLCILSGCPGIWSLVTTGSIKEDKFHSENRLSRHLFVSSHYTYDSTYL